MRKIISAGKKKQLFYEKLKGDVLKAVVCFQPFFVQNCWRKEENDCKRYDTRTFLIKNPIYRQSWDDSIESPHEYIVAAMWSLRPQVIWKWDLERKMTNFITVCMVWEQFTPMKSLQKVTSKTNWHNLNSQAIHESSPNNFTCPHYSSLTVTVFNETFLFPSLVILFSDFVHNRLGFILV